MVNDLKPAGSEESLSFISNKPFYSDVYLSQFGQTEELGDFILLLHFGTKELNE